MADVTRQSDVSAGAREQQQQQQPLMSKSQAVAAFEQQMQQKQQVQQQQEEREEQQRLAAESTPALTPALAPEEAAAAAPTPTTTAPLRPDAIALTPGSPEGVLTKTATRPVEAIPPAHAAPGAGLAASLASAVPAAVLRHAPAAIAGPLAATAAQAHVSGGGLAAARVPMAAVGRTVTTTWAECDPAVKSLVAATFAGAYGATIGGMPHPANLSLSSPSRASCAERVFAANVTVDGPLLYLRGRERARVAPRLLSALFDSSVFVGRAVTLALVGSAPSTAAAVMPGGEWGAPLETTSGGMMSPAGAMPGAAEGGPASPTAAGGAEASQPPGLGRIDVEGTLFLMIKPSLRNLLPFGLGRALAVDVPVAGVWSIVARPSDDKVLSLTARPANILKPPRLLRALWGMASTNMALALTRW